MRIIKRLLAILIVAFSWSAHGDEGFYPIMADDGTVIANHRVPVDIEAEIEKLPGVVIAGNARGSVTVAEFYDVNCPFCRAAAGDIDALLKRNEELRLVLVPFPVLGIPSIQGTRVELAVARLAPAQTFYRFHRLLDSARGTVDGARALAAAKQVGLEPEKILAVADEDGLADVMKAHVRLGDALGIRATPGFVIKGVAFNGYPGPKAFAAIVDAVDRCGAVICDSSAQ